MEVSYCYGCLNRLKKISYGNGIRTQYAYDETNQLSREEGIRVTGKYEYDPQGNVIQEEGERGKKEYQYNSRNQLIQVRCSDGKEQKNRYDGEQLRCEMEEKGSLARSVTILDMEWRERRQKGRFPTITGMNS